MSKNDKNNNKKKNMTASVISGGLAGCCGKTFTAPLSRIVILLQVGEMTKGLTNNNVTTLGKGENFFSSMKRIFQEEGLLSFWRGNGVSVLHRFPYSGLNFLIFEKSMDILTKSYFNFEETPFIRLSCGGMAGGFATLACYPLDLMRTRLAVSNGNSMNIFNGLNNIIKEEGIKGLYAGITPSLAVAIPNMALGYCFYHTFKAYILASNNPMINFMKDCNDNNNDSTNELSTKGSLCAGAFSGSMCAVITFPVDVIRRRMQVKQLLGEKVGFMKDLFKQDGMRGLYRGVVPEIFKVVPMVAITFSVYEACMNLAK